MKFSHRLVILFFLIFFSCEKKQKRLLVRPLEKNETYSIYTTIFPIDTHPCMQFGEQWLRQRNNLSAIDTFYVYRIQVVRMED